MSRFVRPETTVLQISRGDTITVRRRLNAGETRARFERMSVAGADGGLLLNRLQVGLATLTAYLLDWSLVDDHGDQVIIRDVSVAQLTDTLNALDQETFVEILSAVDAHETAMTAERAAEKNGHDGGKAGSAISPSPSEPAGQLTMSAG